MRAVIVDDHKFLTDLISRELTRSEIFSDIKVFNHYHEYLKFTSESPELDFFILDIVMPGVNGIEVIKSCRERYKGDSKVFVLSGITETSYIQEALRIGVNGFMNKASPLSYLTEGISSILTTGGIYLCPVIQKILVQSLTIEDELEKFNISNREKEILSFLCEGFTVKEISGEMYLSVHTIQAYLKSLMKKMKVNRTVDLVIYAISNGLVSKKLK